MLAANFRDDPPGLPHDSRRVGRAPSAPAPNPPKGSKLDEAEGRALPLWPVEVCFAPWKNLAASGSFTLKNLLVTALEAEDNP
jgi:hypothetical protein